MDCHYIDKANGRITLFTFNFTDEGFNQVYARDAEDAYDIATRAFGSKLKVDKRTIREVTDRDAYYNNFPLMD